MTTFTTDDREEAYKKILEEAPAHIGYEDAVEPIPFAGLVQLQESKHTKTDCDEAFFSLGKLMARLPLDEAKRLEMMVRIICSYVGQLEKENDRLRNGDEFDMDGRC
jgi:hypothetical protein